MGGSRKRCGWIFRRYYAARRHLLFICGRRPKTSWLDISEVHRRMYVPLKLSYIGIPVVKKASGGGLVAAEFHDFSAFGGTMLSAATCFSSAEAAENAVVGHFGGTQTPARTSEIIIYWNSGGKESKWWRPGGGRISQLSGFRR